MAPARPAARRQPRAERANPPPSGRRRRAPVRSQLGAAQQRHGSGVPSRARPARPTRPRRARRSRRARPQRPTRDPARRLLVERHQQPRRGRGHGQRRPATPMGRPRGRAGRPQRVRAGDLPAREAHRALHADRRQSPLHVGGRGRREHRRRGAQRDERERDEQRDHDPGGVVDEHPDPALGGEAHAADLRARRPRLLEQHVDVRRVVGPDQRLVDGEAHALAEQRLLRDVDPRRRRQGKGDVVGRERDAHDRQRAQAPHGHGLAGPDLPRLGHAAIDDDLVGRSERSRPATIA